MGKRINGQGQSRNTRRKEEFFGFCLGFSMAVHAKRNPGHVYYHCDLNAGCGENRAAGVVGSPELFFRQAKKHAGVPVRAFFIEKSPARAKELQLRLAQNGLAQKGLFGMERLFQVVKCDNAKVMEKLPDVIAKWENTSSARGSIISDPNGWSPKRGGLDLVVAQRTLDRLPRFVLLMSFQFGRAKCVRGWSENGKRGCFENATLRKVADYLPLRRHWLISEPAGQWVYLCGTSEPYPEDRKRGTFVRLDSGRGREILHVCDTIGERFS